MHFIFWLLLCLTTLGIEAGSGMQDLAYSKHAFFQADLEKTIQLLESAYADVDLEAEKKSEAGRRLGTLYWRYKNDNENALDWFNKAKETEEKLDTLYRARSRFYAKQNKFNAAREDLVQAKKYSDSINSKLETLKARFRLIISEAKNGNLSQAAKEEAALLLNAAKNEMHKKPYDFQIANKAISLAIINNNLTVLIKAWHNYFNASSKQGLAESIVNAGKLLKTLSRKNSIQELTSEQYQNLVIALGQSRFFEHLQLLDRKRIADNSSDFVLSINISQSVVLGTYSSLTLII